jgi:hypothetical protein
MTATFNSYPLDSLVARQPPGSPQRALVEQLAGGVTVQRVREALELLRGDPLFGDVASSLGGFHIETLVAACLPGLSLTNLDVRGMTSRHLMDLRGDLWLRVSDAPFGVEVVVCTLRGAYALRDMGREGRAPITSCRALPTDPEDAGAIERQLSELDFDGLRSLSVHVDRAELAVGAISRAPSLASYGGPLTVEIARALATSSVSEVLVTATSCEEALRALAPAQHLRKLTLNHDQLGDHLRPLPTFPSLRELHLRGRVVDADLGVVADISPLERLFTAKNALGDAGGVELGRLSRLRALDLHNTEVGDATMLAICGLPLEELDVAGTRVGIIGVEAVVGTGSMRRIGLDWAAPELIAVAQRFGVKAELNDDDRRGGALWHRYREEW